MAAPTAMTRIIEHIEGLCLEGGATLGESQIKVPALLEGNPGDGSSVAPGSLPLIDQGGAPSGRRFLSIGASPPLELDLPIAAPEISGSPTGFEEVRPGVVLLRGPVDADRLSSLRPHKPNLVILSNARQLFAEGEPFVRALEGFHAGLGGGPLLWAPRAALPHRVPLLAYLGVDLLDTTEGLMQTLHGLAWDEALGGDPEPQGAGPAAALERAREEYRRALSTTRTAIRRGRLRELVESRLTAEPALGEMLRYADRTLGTLLESRTAVVGDGHLGRYVLAEAIRRPEMRRFRERLLERYRPPPLKEVLLLVPCSRTKPYRLSRSHRRLARAWEGIARTERLHVVSVSSPIGVVPRELEDVFPARNYDIPVTGDWSEAEREFVRVGLAHLLREGRYRSVIVHLDPQEYGFLRETLGDERPTVWTLGDERTTSEEAISALHGAVEEALADLAPVAGGPLAVVRQELEEVASWQFGRAVAERLFQAPFRLMGRPWFQRLTDGAGTDLASWREERGLFHLTVAGARRIDAADNALAVDADPRVPLSGDLFAPGVIHADAMIRIGDAVRVRQEGDLAAVGEAVLPGPLMTTVGHGLAVRIRHRASRSTDTPLTARVPPPPGPVV